MNSLIKSFFAKTSLLSIALLGLRTLTFAGTVPIQVNDGNGNGIAGAKVFAVHFGQNGPDGSTSVLGTTDGSGTVTITLTDDLNYDLLVDAQNHGPSLRSQMFNPEHPRVHVISGVNPSRTLVLPETLSRAVIISSITNATPSTMLFGNVRKISSGSDVAMGACVTDGSGSCFMTFNNIPALDVAGSAQSYDVSAFDSQANGGQGKGNGGQLTGDVEAGHEYGIALDMNGGLPPDLSANSGSQKNNGNNNGGQNGPGGLVTVEGVIEDINSSSTTVPFGGLSFRVVDQNGQKQDRFGTGVDQNGRFQIFATLEVGTTYFVRAFGGCRQDNICFDGYESSTTVPVFSRGDFLYDSSSSIKVIHVKLKRALPGNVNLAVYAKGSNGRGLPGTNINIFPDGTQWHTDPASVPLCAMGFNPVNISSPGFVNKNL